MCRPSPSPRDLRFPGKAVVLPSGNFLVSDTTRHQLVELARRRREPSYGGSTAVRTATFKEPQGLALLPDGRIAVADTVNHSIRAYDPETGVIETLAGTGKQWWQGSPTEGPALRGRPLVAVGRGLVAGTAVDRDGRSAPAVDL